MLRNKIQQGYQDLFNATSFDVMITLHFDTRLISSNAAYRLLKEMVRKIAKHRKTQVAGFGVFNNLKSQHAHLLIFGKTRSLNELSTEEVGRLWGYGSAHISKVTNKGAAFYLALNMTPNLPDKSELFFFNLRILKKVCINMSNTKELKVCI